MSSVQLYDMEPVSLDHNKGEEKSIVYVYNKEDFNNNKEEKKMEQTNWNRRQEDHKHNNHYSYHQQPQ